MRALAIALAALGLVGCATAKTQKADAPAPNPATNVAVVEPSTTTDAPERVVVPVGALARVNRYPQRASSDGTGEPIRISEKAGGWPIKELLKTVSDATGATLHFESNNATIKSRTVDFIGEQVIPQAEALDWLQNVLAFQSLTIVPIGDLANNEWFALDSANPNATGRPVFVSEDDLPDWDGSSTYVVSTLSVSGDFDMSRVRQSLSQLSTKTAGLGRISEIPGANAMVVADFAKIVVSMRQLLDNMEIAAYEARSRK